MFVATKEYLDGIKQFLMSDKASLCSNIAELYEIFPHNNNILTDFLINVAELDPQSLVDNISEIRDVLPNRMFERIDCGSFSLIIPSSIKSFQDYSFAHSSLKKFYYIENDTYKAGKINNGAFYECSDLTYVDISQADMIGLAAFEGCVNLKSINCPNVREIRNEAFVGCKSLRNLVLPKLIWFDIRAFNECQHITLSISKDVISDWTSKEVDKLKRQVNKLILL